MSRDAPMNSTMIGTRCDIAAHVAINTSPPAQFAMEASITISFSIGGLVARCCAYIKALLCNVKYFVTRKACTFAAIGLGRVLKRGALSLSACRCELLGAASLPSLKLPASVLWWPVSANIDAPPYSTSNPFVFHSLHPPAIEATFRYPIFWRLSADNVDLKPPPQ